MITWFDQAATICLFFHLEGTNSSLLHLGRRRTQYLGNVARIAYRLQCCNIRLFHVMMWFSNTVIKTFRLLGSQISEFYSDTLIIYWSQISLHPHVSTTAPFPIGIGIWFWIHIDNKYQLRQVANETFFTHWNVEETSSDRRAFLKGGVQFSTYATRLLLRLASGMPDVHMYVRPSQSLQAKEEWNEKAATASVASPPRQLQRYLKELTDEFKSTESNRSFERKEEDFQKKHLLKDSRFMCIKP